MTKQKTIPPKNEQYSAKIRKNTEKRHVKTTVAELSTLFEDLNRDRDAIFKLHLSAKIIFQKYAHNLDCTVLSWDIKSMGENLQRKEMSRTVTKNIVKTLKRMDGLGFVPLEDQSDPLKPQDPLSKHSPPEFAVSILKVVTSADQNKNEISKSERESLLQYFKLVRNVLRTPERMFVRSVKILRDQKSVSKFLLANVKIMPVLRSLWVENSLDPEKINPDNKLKLEDALEKAFRNEKNPEVR